jgi:nicotinic acid mononucleotide adenylyltransferase
MDDRRRAMDDRRQAMDDHRQAIGVYPGTFNPVTVGHLAIMDAAWRQHRLQRLDLVLSEVPLVKHGGTDLAPLPERVALTQRAVADRPWATVRTTTDQLLTDIARGYDVVVMGADKWAQIHDVAFYGGDPAARDAAVAALPTLAIARRGDIAIPPHSELAVPDWVAEVSATAVRNGRHDWHGVTD